MILHHKKTAKHELEIHCWAMLIYKTIVEALIIIGILLPFKAFGYERSTVAKGSKIYLHWNQRNIEYYINEAGYKNLPLSEVVGAIKRAFYSWSSPSCTDITFTFDPNAKDEHGEKKYLLPAGYTKTNFNSSTKDNKNMIIWRTQWPPPGAIIKDEFKDNIHKIPALTTLNFDANTGTIWDADIDLNAYDFTWTTGDTNDKNQLTDIQNILTHEIGHLLGFADLTKESDKANTMYGQTIQGELDKRTLEADDIKAVCQVYPFRGETPTGPGESTEVIEVAQGGCQFAPTLSVPPLSLAEFFVLGLIFAYVIRQKILYRSVNKIR